MEKSEQTTVHSEVSMGTEMSTEEAKEPIEFKIAAAVFKYYSPVQLSIALFGNLMILLVFSRKSMHRSVTSFLFRVLAVADTFMVLVTLVPEAILELGNSSAPYSSVARCKVHGYLYFAGRSYAVWVLVLIVLERFIGVNFPHKAASVITHRRMKIALAAMLLAISLLYLMMPFVLEVAVVRNEEGEIINYFCKVGGVNLPKFTKKVFPLYDLCIYSLIPFIIMLCANISIIYRLVQGRRMRMKTTSGNDPGDLKGMTAMLLGISFGFIACTLPYNVSLLQRKTHGLNDPGSYLFWALGAVLANLNHCINFYIYCLTGSRFRREIQRMLGCKGSVLPRSNTGNATNSVVVTTA